MSRRRRLHPDELELWQQIARSADPLHKHRKPVQDKPTPKQPPVPRSRSELPPITRFGIGDAAAPLPETHAQPRTTTTWLRSDPVNMDARAFTRMKRGKLVPEARIDLHGMTLDQAHPELLRFILGSQTRGLRLVLVITGKGGREDPYDPMPMRRGVLKRQVPLWLKQPPAAQAVLQVSEAHLRHGGSGAYYVYLKRRR
jgi:DNA-nicking Smr family endonuclease